MGGLDQYSVKAFAESFLIIPKTLAENAGHNHVKVLADLLRLNLENKEIGIDLETGYPSNSVERNILDCLNAKLWAIRLASEVATTILQVDHIIMSKPSGGPKPKQNKNWDDD